jgi:type VI secretion system secreted protein VgrG
MSVRSVDALSRLEAAGRIASASNLVVRVASGDALDVRHFRIEERLSELFSIRLRVVSANHDLGFGAIVGEPATFEIHGGVRELGRDRVWTGICKECRLVRVETAGLSTYELEIVPALWLLTQRRNHRIFQQVSEIDIVETLLGEWGIPYRKELGAAYPPREYRVQYAESDYAFLCRMLEDAGVTFWFRETDDGTELVLGDAPQRSEPRAHGIAFRDEPSLEERDHVTKVALSQRMTPGGFTVRDYDTRLAPDFPLLAGAKAAEGSVESRLEQFVYAPGAFLFAGAEPGDTPAADDRGVARSNLGEAAAIASRRLEAIRKDRVVVTFETSANDLAPGVVFSILEHPRADLGEPLLVSASIHEGAHDSGWAHHCEARPASIPHRPTIATPRPRVSGVETATVVGPAGEEIHVDEFGRVRVHFHWDRESKRNERSSTWLPVSQSWGGAGYGGTNLPRIGQEVIVDFLGGDPDRPVVTGRIYTNLQKTPYKLPDNKTQSGWKSCSTNQTGGYNEIMFEDAAGRELFRVQAEKDLDKLVKNDERVVIGHDRTKLVKHDDRLTVEHDRRKNVDHDETTRIGHDRSELVQHDERIVIGNDRDELVVKNEDIVVGKNRSKVVKRHEREVVALTRTRVVGVNEAVMVGIGQQVKVGVDQSTSVGKNRRVKVGKNQDLSVGGRRTVKVAKTDTETVGLAKMVTVGAALQTTVGGIMNTTVGASQSEQVATDKSVVAGTSISLKCGRSSLVLEASGKITMAIEGGASVVLADKNATVTAPSGGVVVIQGGPEVHLNP